MVATAKSIVTAVGGNMTPPIFLELPSHSGHVLRIASLTSNIFFQMVKCLKVG